MDNKKHNLRDELYKLKKQIKEKENQFSAYLRQANEAIWRIDLTPPISLDAPESQQVQEIFNNAVYTEANDATAIMYGFKKGEELINQPVRKFLPQSDDNNVKSLQNLVRNKFNLKNIVTCEQNNHGNTLYVINNVTPVIKDNKVCYTWGTHLDITELMVGKKKLEYSEKMLKKHKKDLEHKNITLKVLIRQIELDKQEFKDQIMANMEKVIFPSLNKIIPKGGTEKFIDEHRKSLKDFTSSFGHRIDKNKIKLTPREIEICNLVKNGNTNKEIADLLSIALHTVEKHRRNARDKFGLTKKGINLNTYLNSL